MNEKFDYKNSLTDIKASLFDIYEDQERVIGSIDPALRDKHVSEFIEVKDLALSLLEKIQGLYDNSLVTVEDRETHDADDSSNDLDPDFNLDNNSDEESSEDDSDINSNELDDKKIISTDDDQDVENTDYDSTQNDDGESDEDDSDLDSNDVDDQEITLPDDDSTQDNDGESGEDDSNLDSNDIDSDKYYLLCDENDLHFAYVSEKLFNKIKDHHDSGDNLLEDDTDLDSGTSDGKIYKKDDLPVKGIIVRNDQYMKLALSKHRQEGVLKEAKNYRVETVKRKRQEQQKIELEKAKVHLDI